MSLTRADLLVLAATAARPRATAAELASLMNMEASTVSRTRRKLERRGVWRPAFALDLARLSSEPLVTFFLETGGSAANGKVAEELRRTIADLDTSGAFLAADGKALGFITPRSVSKLQAVNSRLLELPSPTPPGRLVMRSDHAVFPAGARSRLGWPNYEPFMRAVLREQFGADPPIDLERNEGRRPRARELSITEMLVAKELIANPTRPLAAATRAVRLPQSTFAHVKMTLLDEGVLKESVRIDPLALGYPFMLITARAHRPHNPHALAADLAHHPCAATAPVVTVASDTHGFALTPVATQACAAEASADFERRSARFDLIAPTTTMVLSAERAAVAGYTSPMDAVGAGFRSWITP